MKRVGKFCLCLAGGLAVNASLRAVEAVSPDNPYAPIATRNVFAINPPLPTVPDQPPAEPPPKITPNGIMSIYGRLQVLFKVVIPPKSGQPGKEQAYVLSEGQRQDDIEVTKIDETAGSVTFNNHGTIQDLLLVNKATGGTSAPAQGGPAPGPGPSFTVPRSTPGGGNTASIIQFGSRAGQTGGVGRQNPLNAGNNANNANNAGVNLGSRLGVFMGGGGNSGPQASAQPQAAMSADDQAVLVAAQHLNAHLQNDPTAAIFPPTAYDTEVGVPSNVAPDPTLASPPAGTGKSAAH